MQIWPQGGTSEAFIFRSAYVCKEQKPLAQACRHEESSPKFKTCDWWDLVIGSDGEMMRPDGHFIEPTILVGIESCSSSIKWTVLEDGGGEGAESTNTRCESISHLWVLGTKSGQQQQKPQSRRKD